MAQRPLPPQPAGRYRCTGKTHLPRPRVPQVLNSSQFGSTCPAHRNHPVTHSTAAPSLLRRPSVAAPTAQCTD
eukprot:scaffold10457_cov106-Isochrysis_galbana.AAC.1